MGELNPRPLAPEARIIPLDQRPTRQATSWPITKGRGSSVNPPVSKPAYCHKPPWPNGQGAPLLRVRLWVRVPLGVAKKYFFSRGPKTGQKYYPVWDSNPRPERLVPKTSALDHSATLPLASASLAQW